jgi:hypothetical protein
MQIVRGHIEYSVGFEFGYHFSVTQITPANVSIYREFFQFGHGGIAAGYDFCTVDSTDGVCIMASHHTAADQPQPAEFPFFHIENCTCKVPGIAAHTGANSCIIGKSFELYRIKND